MLSITDINAFERMLTNALDGKANVFELGDVFKANADQPSVAQAANLDFALDRDVA